ncbi:GNAT family N-acetyltransferase [Streptococcus parasuis]|uniref:GNAT family N-acyltransferase n=1 Tax=Streptococcus parasuis TaxID=1501662 RepID=A0ABV2ETB4_9STRE|nr:GNAT family N-acetyltransferase [Streptococcus parasuis]BCP60059.1 GNAT family acetyltransferase [Streptococcus parasuis]
MNEPDVELVIGSEPWHRACSMYVRYRVFVMEKSIAREDEFDQYDEVGRVYANLLVHGEPVSTGRFLPTEFGTARLTRIATLAPHRGKGYAREIIQKLEEYAKNTNVLCINIHSELTAKTFYEMLGYQPTSEIYLEDGEWCQTLTKNLI